MIYFESPLTWSLAIAFTYSKWQVYHRWWWWSSSWGVVSEQQQKMTKIAIHHYCYVRHTLVCQSETSCLKGGTHEETLRLWVTIVTILFLFLRRSSSDSLLISSLSLHTIPSEHLLLKCSFSFTHYTWFHCPVSTYPLRMSFFFYALPQHSLIPSITQPSFLFRSILALVLQTLLGLCATYPSI